MQIEKANPESDTSWLLQKDAMVDHFRVIRPLGRGSLSQVYLARDTQLGRKLALKILISESIDAQEIQSMNFEARATARFNHPHIVTVYSAGNYRSRPYLALEYVQGQTLRQRITKVKITTNDAMRIGLDIARALREAHTRNVLHGDLKPENVIIGQDGQLRVLDFGLAQLLPGTNNVLASLRSGRQAEPTFEQTDFDVLGAQGLQGTPAYMAPELWDQQKASDSSDIWAFGVLLYELLCGQRPFVADTIVQMALKICENDLPTGVLSESSVPAELSNLVQSCLHKAPDQRPSADEIVQQLSDLLSSKVTQSTEDNCPFRGLMPFDEQHQHLFFGRDYEITAFAERMRTQAILPLVGPSGTGKSSFIKAGIIPRLREQGPLVVLSLRPGPTPFIRLANRIVAARKQLFKSEKKQQTGAGDEIQLLASQLSSTPTLLNVVLHRLAESRKCTVLLFVDQYEELFTLEPDVDVRDNFTKAICNAADDPDMPVRVVFTLREEFLSRLTEGPSSRELLGSTMVLRRPARSQLRDILSQPFEYAGCSFEDADLVEEMITEVENEMSCLPLLQFTCRKLWERLDKQTKHITRRDYQALGGVAGALAQHADGVIASMPTEHIKLVRSLFLRLVTPEKTRKVLMLAELTQGLGDEAGEVVRRLVDSRLLAARQSEEEKGEIELTHESLIIAWNRLSKWIDESQDELSFLAEVNQAADLWKKRGMRKEEVWQGEALHEAERSAKHCTTEIPNIIEQFLAAGRKQENWRLLRKRSMFLSFVLIIGLVAIGTWYGLNYRTVQSCKDTSKEFTGIWDNTSKKSVKSAFLATGKPYAQGTWERVERIFGKYLGDWKLMRGDVCEAKHTHGTQSEELFDLRMTCLKERKQELKALSKLFVKADDGVVKKAVQASSSLTEIEICADDKALRAAFPPPKTEEAKRKVASIRERLAEVEALDKTGKHKMGLELAKQLRVKAETVGYRPVQAEILYQLGSLFSKTGNYDTAEKILYEAFRLAGESRDPLLAAKALSILTWVIGFHQARIEDGLLLSKTAQTMLDVAGGDERTLSSLLFNKGSVQLKQGEYSTALESLHRALTISEKTLGPEHPAVAGSLNSIGAVFKDQGKYDKALEYFQKSMAIFEKELGPEHPAVASILNNIGIVFLNIREHKKASEYFQKSIAIFEKELGPEHPDNAASIFGLGTAFNMQGKYDKALEYFQRAMAIFEKELGPEHPNCAMSMSGLGLAFHMQGKYRIALDHYSKALAIWERALGSEHSYVANLLNSIGDVFQWQGQYEKSLKYSRRALAIYEKTMGPRHAFVSNSLNSIGYVFQRKNQYEKSLKYFRRALAIREEAFGSHHRDVACTLTHMGRVFYKKGEYENALEYYRKALLFYENLEHATLDSAWSLSWIGENFVAQGEHKQAIKHLEKVAGFCEKQTCNLPPFGEGLFALARALVATGGHKPSAVRRAAAQKSVSRQRAITLAKKAQEIFRKTPKRFKKELKEVNTWLKKHAGL